jgi:hypothetical protein
MIGARFHLIDNHFVRICEGAAFEVLKAAA